MIKKILALISIPVLCYATDLQKPVVTIIIPHSQSLDACRIIAGWQDYVNVQQERKMYGVFAITPEFTLSYRPERIAESLFGSSIVECKNTFTIAGSERPNRAADAWLADYFGLPPDFESAVRVNPQNSNFIIDADGYVGWDRFVPGLYTWIDIPLVYTRWDLHMHEAFILSGTTTYEPGYVNATGIDRNNLVHDFTAFIQSEKTPQAADLIFRPLTHAKMSCSVLELCRLSDIQLALGWNALHCPDYHLGANARMVIPLGNKPCGDYLFEPLIGNGGHWELGGGISAHYIVWHDYETDEKVGLYADMNLTHMFTSYQKRTFDLCKKPNSRYMLASRFSSRVTNALSGSVDGQSTAANTQYISELSSVANLTTLPVAVSCGMHADLVLMFVYTHKKNSWAFGYGFWGRSCEDLSLCGTPPFVTEQWALKGDAYLFGFTNNGAQTPVALSATESNATIQAGTNFAQTDASTPALVAQGMQNPNIDNPAPAFSGSTVLVDQPGGTQQINTSIQPILLSVCNIHLDSARTRGMSNRIFAHVNHTIRHPMLKPYMGFGAEIEFGQRGQCSKNINNERVSCFNTALSFWGVWIKGGVAF